jgi:phosphomevalonate kinase
MILIQWNRKKDINKTGLGSSAAMVTSLVAALLCHFNAVDINKESGREIVHRVAQFVHCLAQGKVGSGFDVSSATFGSQKYTRFDSAVLQKCLETAETANKKSTNVVCDKATLQVLINDLELNQLSSGITKPSVWDHKHTAFQLPTGFHLFVADVDQGSNTPSMVRSVLQWKSQKKEAATKLWNKIDELNNKTEELFNELQTYANENLQLYQSTLSQLNSLKASEWNKQYDSQKQPLQYKIADCMSRLRTTFTQVRYGMKQMGNESKVPIEPDEQTKLLDATMDVNGCLLAGVPGAGGFDAISCILFGDEISTKQRVEQMWLNYQGADVCPLLLGESNSKGVVLEDV